jgi:hypothetical protein
MLVHLFLKSGLRQKCVAPLEPAPDANGCATISAPARRHKRILAHILMSEMRRAAGDALTKLQAWSRVATCTSGRKKNPTMYDDYRTRGGSIVWLSVTYVDQRVSACILTILFRVAQYSAGRFLWSPRLHLHGCDV